MFVYDKTFDPKVVVGHCDLISWFTDFALYPCADPEGGTGGPDPPGI